MIGKPFYCRLVSALGTWIVSTLPLAASDSGSPVLTSIQPGSVATYRLLVESSDGAPDGEAPAARLTVARGGAGAEREVVLFIESDGDLPSSRVTARPPVLFFQLTPEGLPPAFVRIHTLESLIAGSLFTDLQGGALAPGSRWESDETVATPLLPRAVELAHDVQTLEERPGAVRFASRLAVNEGAPLLGVTQWDRELVVDTALERVVAARVRAGVRTPDVAGESRSETLAIELEEIAHRRLAPEEAQSLKAESAALRDVIAALDQARRGSPFSIFGGPEDEEPADPLALLASYESAHPQGILSPAAAAVRRHVEERAERLAEARARRERIENLTGKPAPDFTLKDLDGKSVSLSDFRGKAVLLAFWGYG